MRKIYLLLLAVCSAAIVNAQVTEKKAGDKPVSPSSAIAEISGQDRNGAAAANKKPDNVQVEATAGVKQSMYPTLKAAFDAINAGTHKGVITISILGNTIEEVVPNAATLVLKRSGEGDASYQHITILPAGGEKRVVKGAAAEGFPFVDIHDSKNVFVYGFNKSGDLLTILDTTVSVVQPNRVEYLIDENTHQLRPAGRKTEEPVAAVNTGRDGGPTPEVISATTYAFTSGTGTLEDMSSGTTLLMAADIDDAASAVTPIGFDFWFDGVRQTLFSVNANGLVRLGVAAVSTAFSNDLASATNVPQIAPYWDDLWTGNNGKVHYKIVGSAPNRKLVIEWQNEQIPRVAAATAGAGTFQAWLYESTGKIEFVYGAGIAVNSANSGYSVGFGSSATQFVSVTTSGPTAAYGTANNAQTNAITSGTKYTFTALVPADPDGLSFTAVGLNGMTLNWSDNATNEVGYAIYRSLDGTNYEFIRQTAANATSSVETGLASNTTYYWKIYAVTEGTLSNALSGSQATSTGTLSGTANIGPTGTYASIGAAVTAINTNGLAGNYTLELQSAYSSAGETFPLVLNVLGSPSNTITLRPETGAAGLSITSANTTATLDLNGATGLVIDGRAGGVGTSQLTIANTATAGVAVRLINGASRNTLTYCTIQGVNTSTTSGVVLFSTSTGVTGNNFNTISNSDIKDGATNPVNGITSVGTSATGTLNTGNTITNNNISNFFSAGSATTGILVTTNTNLSNTGWTITNNKVFQTATRTYTTGNTHRGILVSGGSDYTVSGNTVGFANSGGTGTYTMTGAVATGFVGVQLQVGNGTNNLQGNTVSGINITTTSGALTGISVTGGSVNVGTVSGNTVGGATGNGAITLNTSTTGGAFIVGLNASGSLAGTVNISNNNIGSLTATGTATVNANINATQLTGGLVTFTNNVVGSLTTANSIQITSTGASATAQQLIGLLGGMTMPTTISNNTFANLTNAGTGTAHVVRGCQVQSSTLTTGAGAGTATVTSNTIHDITGATANTTVAGGGTGVQGFLYTGTSPNGATVSQNTIYAIIATNTGAVANVAAGIGYSNPSNGNITRNKIYDIRNASTGTTATAPPMAIGLLIRAALGTNTTFANNMISLGSSQTTNTQFVGIMNSFTTNQVSVHYNSVHIEGTAASGALPSYAFLRGDNSAASAITTVVDIKNNVFDNTRTGGTGKHYAIGNVNSVPATGWAAGASNNNVLNNTVAANLGIWGLAADQTFATWKSTSSCDLASLSAVSVPFTAAATADLHVNFGVTPTPLESGGTAVTTTIDYDNQTRPGPAGSVNGGATAPDIGADEFDGVPQDITPPSITYTALGNTCGFGNRTLTATISDASGVPTSGIGLPVLYWKINAGAYTPATATFISGNTYQFTFGAGVTTGDVVSYYVMAQDNVGNITAFPGGGAGGFTANPPAAATPPTSPSTYTISVTISGTYTVGAAGTYTTLNAAFNAYNTSCLGGPVVFNLIDAAYTNTSDTLKVNADASAVNTLTIKTTIAGTTITGNSAVAPIVLLGADYVTIDGSISNTANTVCPASAASRDLTITNTNTGTSSAIVSLNTTAGGDAATNNTIKNCVLVGNANTTTVAGVNISGTAIGSGTGANLNNNNAVVNNDIQKCQLGIFSAGAAVATKNQNNIFNQNIMTATGANSIGRTGIMVLFENNPTISGNQIKNIVSAASNDVFAIGVGVNGISTTTIGGGETSGATVTNNVIDNVSQSGTFSSGGILVQAASAGTTNISNNMISNVIANGTSGDYTVGILAGGGTGTTTNIYHNSVSITGTQTGGSYPSYAVAIAASNTVNLKNNILVTTGSTGANMNRAIGLNFALPASNLVSDNNDLFVSGTGSAIAQTTTLANTGGVNHSTLLNWQTNATQDANSKNVQPTFVSGTNLHLVTPDAVNFTNLESTGAAVGIASDIDCQSRPNGSAPDLGADEFVGSVPTCNTPTAVLVGSITTTTASVSFTCTGCTGTYIVEYGLPGFTPGTGATAGVGGTVVTGAASPIGLSGLTPATTYQVYVRQDCGLGSYSTNSTVVSFTTLCNALNVPYSENFDGVTPPAVPTCSVVEDINGSTTWATAADNPRSSPNALRYVFESSGVVPGDDWWHTPGLNLTGGTSYRLTFWYRARSGTFPEAMEVKYGTTQSAAGMTAGTLFSNTSIGNTTYAQASVDFTPASTGVYYIGFHDISLADEWNLYVDDINVDVTPLCPAPTSLSVGTITSSSAIASWTGSGSFILEYGLTGFTPGTGATAGVGGTVINPAVSPQSITGLLASTTYQVYVRQNCTGAGNGYSTNAGPVSFTTLAAPPANDDAPGAITLTVGAGCTGSPYTNAAATQSASEPFAACKGSAGFNTVWFKFVAPASGAVKVSNDFSGGTMGGDSRMALFSATNVNNYATFTNVACDDDNGVTQSLRSTLYATGLTAGNTYYIQVDGFSASTTQGTFCIAVDELATSMLTTATTCTSGQTLFGFNDNYTGWISATDNSGNLVALISNQTGGAGTSDISNSNNINAAAVRTDAVTGQRYLDRNVFLSSTTVTSANVRFFFLNTELSALQAVDGAVTTANLQATRQTGTTCQGDFVAANGTNTSLAQTANGSGTGYGWIQVTSPGFSNFYLHTSKSFVPVKSWLQGAYNTGVARHKDVTATWAGVLNASALSQPYNTPAFGNYAGTETVAGGFFTSTAGTTDVLDWVLLELRDQTTPSTIITRRAAFIREDGRIVDLDGTSDVAFRALPNNNYFVVIRHRNHLPVRSSVTKATDGTLGIALPSQYDFSTAQSQAFQDGAVVTNAAMVNLGASGVFGMWGGNANANTNVRYTGLNNDAGAILTALGGNQSAVLTNVYNTADLNMDGTLRYTGLNNDVGFLLSILGGIQSAVFTQHQ